MRNYLAIPILMITLIACGEKSDSYSYLFNCGEFIERLEQKNADLMANKEYRTARRAECDAARGKISDTFRNISYARLIVADAYVSFGDLGRAAEMYKASVAAILIDDSWKNETVCSSAAMAAGRLASLGVISQDERAQFAKNSAIWGNQDGTYFYARYLEQGQGALRDLVSAYAWYNVTAAYAEGRRSKVAQEAIAKLDSELPIQARLQAQLLSRTLEAEIKSHQDCKYMVNG